MLLETLGRLSLLAERSPIIVVDNGSSDDTRAAVRAAYPRVRVIPLESNCGSAARNVGVHAATTAFIAFCDDDCWWTDGALPLAVATLTAHPEVAVVNGRVCVGVERRTDDACDSMASSPLRSTNGVPGTAIASFMAGAIVVRRDAFLDAGGYHPRFLIGAEEPLLALDLREAGYDLLYAPGAVLVHMPATTARDPAGRRHLVMRNRLWTAWLRYPFAAACETTLAAIRAASRDRGAARAFWGALRGALWVLRERRPVSHATARTFRMLVGSA